MVGQTVGKYRIVSRLGRGGMGTVYKAVDATLDREVAIKCLNADLGDADLLKRFRAEAIALARLNHPNIATLFELTEHEGQLLMVMEFVRGDTFDRVSQREGPLPVGRAAQLCSQVLDALAHAHRAGVVHRDLKPANLMLTESGLVKVMDFGLARMAGTERLTCDGYMVGTPAYMPPEQVLGREIDGRADLYAMGVVLFRLLTGQLPFKADSGIAMVQHQLNDAPTPVRQLRQELSDACEAVVARALSKPAGDRYQTAEEFKEALSELDRPTMTAVPPIAPTTPSPTPVLPHDEGTMPLTPTPMTPAAVGLPPPAVAMPRGAGSAAKTARGRNTAMLAAVGAAVLLIVGIPGVLFWRAHRMPAVSSPPLVTAPQKAPAREAAPPAATAPQKAQESAPAPAPPTAPAAAPTTTAGGAGSVRASLPTPPSLSPATPGVRAEVPSVRVPAPSRPASTTKSGDSPSSARAMPAETAGPVTSAPSSPPPAAATPPAVAPASPPVSPAPAPVAPALSFEGLKLLTLDEDEERTDLDATLRLGPDHLEVVDDSTKVHAVAYTQIIGLFYSRGKDPRWTTPEGRSAAVMKGGGGPMSFMRPTRDWVTIRTAAAFFPLRVPAEDLQRVTSALEARTGLKVLTAK